MKPHALRWLSAGVVALALPLAAVAQQQAYARTPVNLRAGPSGSYPLVATLGPGQPVDVLGCTPDFTWCDVGLPDGLRGWAYAPNLDYAYEERRVPIATYGAVIGVPVVTFVIGSYWSSYYRDRPWYGDRRWWHGRPPPPPSPGWRPPPPPRPQWRPNPWPVVQQPGLPPGYGPGRPSGVRPPSDSSVRPPRPGPDVRPPRPPQDNVRPPRPPSQDQVRPPPPGRPDRPDRPDRTDPPRADRGNDRGGDHGNHRGGDRGGDRGGGKQGGKHDGGNKGGNDGR